jgi:hypothetical protein
MKLENVGVDTPIYIIAGAYQGQRGQVVEMLTNNAGVRASVMVDVPGLPVKMEALLPFAAAQFIIDMDYYGFKLPEALTVESDNPHATMSDRIARKYYEATLYDHAHYKGDNPHLKKLARDAARHEQNLLSHQFRRDLLTAYGYNESDLLAERLYTKAYADGHSNGYTEVVHQFDALVEMLDGFLITPIDR